MQWLLREQSACHVTSEDIRTVLHVQLKRLPFEKMGRKCYSKVLERADPVELNRLRSLGVSRDHIEIRSTKLARVFRRMSDGDDRLDAIGIRDKNITDTHASQLRKAGLCILHKGLRPLASQHDNNHTLLSSNETVSSLLDRLGKRFAASPSTSTSTWSRRVVRALEAVVREWEYPRGFFFWPVILKALLAVGDQKTRVRDPDTAVTDRKRKDDEKHDVPMKSILRSSNTIDPNRKLARIRSLLQSQAEFGC